MCGIVGYLGHKAVVPVLVGGLKRLEYRGYDSAGIAVVNGGQLQVRRASGKLRNLEESLRQNPCEGSYGIGHTRWATHGRPTEENAHPHRDCRGEVVVVHNGIVETTFRSRNPLIAEGHTFVTETDTEVIAHLVEKHLTGSLEEAVRKTLAQITGIYAVVVLSTKDPHKIIAARFGPPIVVGLGEGESFVASDIPAILAHTRDVVFLGDSQMAILTSVGVQTPTFKGSGTTQRITGTRSWPRRAGHFMLKEIHEQPCAIHAGPHFSDTGKVLGDEDLSGVPEGRHRIAACGTSWHAA